MSYLVKHWPVLLIAATLLPSELAAQESGDGAAAHTLAPTSDWLDYWLHGLTRAGEIVGIAIIVIGAILATVQFLRRIRQPGAYDAYRASLGRAILLGLEFLVAADIIGTVAVDPTLYNLGILGIIVLIRTFLSFSLEVEIEGRWPWQRGPSAAAASRTPSGHDA